jgi:hypothetical protein
VEPAVRIGLDVHESVSHDVRRPGVLRP